MHPDYSNPLPQPPADNNLRQLLLDRLKDAEDRCVQAECDRELYGRVADACQAGLAQLARNEPQPAQAVPNYR